MAEITAAMVKELREKTGAGMMDAKGALVETKGDMEAAVDWLRKKGLAKAAKKSGRTAAEGLVAVAASADNKTAAIIEVNAETDFVGRNEQFQGFVTKAAQIVNNREIKPFELYLFIAVVYWLCTYSMSVMARRLERRSV